MEEGGGVEWKDDVERGVEEGGDGGEEDGG